MKWNELKVTEGELLSYFIFKSVNYKLLKMKINYDSAAMRVKESRVSVTPDFLIVLKTIHPLLKQISWLKLVDKFIRLK